MKFSRKPKKGIWQLSFSHDKADIPRTCVNRSIDDIGSEIVFDDLELKLFFTSSYEDILQLIKSSGSWTLRVKGPRGTHGQAQLDCESHSDQQQGEDEWADSVAE